MLQAPEPLPNQEASNPVLTKKGRIRIEGKKRSDRKVWVCYR